jgi:prevent-host-death family protein
VAITTLSSREFNQDTGRAKKAAANGPVIITDRGKPAHVLLSIEEYRALTGTPKTLGELIGMENADAIEFEAPRLGDEFPIPAEFK